MKKLIAAAFAVALCCAAVAPAVTPKPALKLLTMHPLTLHGSHFLPGRLVRVTVTSDPAGTSLTKRVRSSRLGTFTASLGEPQGFDRCTQSLRIVAVGPRAKVAKIAIPPFACAPA